MKHTLAVLAALAFCHVPSALAKCSPVQCSAVQIRVASCAPAKLNPAGALILNGGADVSSRSGEVGGLVLSGSQLHQQPTPCFVGLPADHGTPDSKEARFFLAESTASCAQLVGRVVVGKTEHPCCDLEPLPGQVHPGVCTAKVRLIRQVRVR